MYPRLNNGEIPTLEDILKMLYDYSIVEDMCEDEKIGDVTEKISLMQAIENLNDLDRKIILMRYFKVNYINHDIFSKDFFMSP